MWKGHARERTREHVVRRYAVSVENRSCGFPCFGSHDEVQAIIRCYGTLEEQRRLNAINPDFAIRQAPNPIFQPPPVRPGYVPIEDSAAAIYGIPADNLWYVFKRAPGVRVLPGQGLTSEGCLILSHELTAEDHTFLWDLKIGTGKE
jgi:hypothetical protein